MPINSYPVTLTPTEAVAPRKGKNGVAYLAFRAETLAGGKSSMRTARVFGDANVKRMAALLKQGVAIAARVAYDGFEGEDGRKAQSMRIVSIG